MSETLELILQREGDTLQLLSPSVGSFTCALRQGIVLSPGQNAGTLIALGRSFELRVPEGASGAIVSTPPERVHAPVGFGDVLYELEPARSSLVRDVRESSKNDAAGGPLLLRSTQSGRFYHRSAPGEPSFVAQGQTIDDGTPVGLIEVMKTFTHVVYRSTGDLPPRARVVRMVASDGADVRAGDALIELAPVEGAG